MNELILDIDRNTQKPVDHPKDETGFKGLGERIVNCFIIGFAFIIQYCKYIKIYRKTIFSAFAISHHAKVLCKCVNMCIKNNYE